MEQLPQEGEVISRTIYARVLRGIRLGSLLTEEIFCDDLDHKDGEFNVRGVSLIKSFTSASQFVETERVTRTELARLLVNAGALPFTVWFRKADGEEREMTGTLAAHEDLMGRSMVRDFDVKSAAPLRQVDHRTIFGLVLDGVKYVLK
jgi:hypothetical protein